MNTDELDFLNNSWGCGFCPIDPTKEDAVKPARGLGAVVVFAAGNAASDVVTCAEFSGNGCLKFWEGSSEPVSL